MSSPDGQAPGCVRSHPACLPRGKPDRHQGCKRCDMLAPLAPARHGGAQADGIAPHGVGGYATAWRRAYLAPVGLPYGNFDKWPPRNDKTSQRTARERENRRRPSPLPWS